MEIKQNMNTAGKFWNGRRVFVTGHSGFKGSWLCMLLSFFNAKLAGYSLKPDTTPALFTEAAVSELSGTVVGDVNDLCLLRKAITDFDPEIVFHMAAQPLVRKSYRDPVHTFNVNMMGTVNLLEACRSCGSLRAIVNVTTDKCYENVPGRTVSFNENDKLGGFDPYSASKACSEIISASYRASFFADSGSVGLATARSGNVIGGGDWAEDRLIPDFFRAAHENREFVVRNADHVRPWQHVLDALNGYMMLGEALYNNPGEFSGAWNFGPAENGVKSVRYVVDRIMKEWPREMNCVLNQRQECGMHEASFLYLDTAKARNILRWQSVWDTDTAIRMTTDWYRLFYGGTSARELSMKQINKFYGEI